MPTFAPFGELPNWQSLPPWATNMPVIRERIEKEDSDNAAKNDKALYFLVLIFSFLCSYMNNE